MNKTLSALTMARMDECCNSLRLTSDRELLESIQAHFSSHPALPGDKALRDDAKRVLDDMNRQISDNETWYDGWEKWRTLADGHSINRQGLEWGFAQTRIRETSLNENFRKVDVNELIHQSVDDLDIGDVNIHGYVSEQAHYRSDVYVGRIEAMLVKDGDEVRVKAKHESGEFVDIGSLPEKFLKNSPMTVDKCPAEIEFADFSNGKLKNLSGKVVVDVDDMIDYGPVINNDLPDDLSDSMDFEDAIANMSMDTQVMGR